MRRVTEVVRGWGGILALTVVLGAGFPASAHADDPDVLVRLAPGVSAAQLAADYGSQVLDQVANTDVYSLAVPDGATEAGFLETLATDSRILYAEGDLVLQSPEFIGDPMHLPFDHSVVSAAYVSQPAYQQIMAPAAQLPTNRTAVSGAGVIVAILDTGANFTHPALAGHLIAGFNVLAPGTVAADIPDGTTGLVAGHGTMVAGLIARLAPRARIMPVRVLNGDGVGCVMDVVKGIHHAIDHGARVINMSFGAPRSSQALEEALEAADDAQVVCVASAGNEGQERPQYPAALRNVLAVASVERDDRKSTYSNFGSFVSVCAPGSHIRSTFWDGGYATWSGTSFAAPFVSVGAALLLSADPNIGADDVVAIISATARNVDRLNSSYAGLLGSGVIDLDMALAVVQEHDSSD